MTFPDFHFALEKASAIIKHLWSSLPSVSSILPARAVVAIVLFGLKELLEKNRSRRTDRRKLRGLKTMLVREVELNNWTIKSVTGILAEIEDAYNSYTRPSFSIKRELDGNILFETYTGSEGSNVGIPEVYNSIMSKQILDIASLDAKLFEAVQNAYDETEELEHIRDMLIEGTEEREHPINDILESFVSYADDELKDIKVSLLPSTRYAP